METIILDPPEVSAVGRNELDITPWVDQDGVDWGEAAMVAYMAERSVGSAPVDFRVPNRTITIPLVIKDRGAISFSSARASIQSKVGEWQNRGGWIKRVLNSGGTVFCDVVSAQLHLGGGWLQARSAADSDAQITAEVLPDFYEAEETLTDRTQTTDSELVWTETTANGGDFPLGDRVRIVVDDDEGVNQKGVIWAFRCNHYDSDGYASASLSAEALSVEDTATNVSKVGASGGQMVTHAAISTSWTPVLSTDLFSHTGPLTHQGTYRVFGRVFSTSGTAVESRLIWSVNDLVNPSENPAVRCYNGGTFHVIDYGEIRLVPPPNGDHSWQGQIQARGEVGSENFSVDKIWMVNTDESMGVLRSPPGAANTAASPVARDEFNQTAGNLDAKTAAVGGAWAEATRTGANGFQTAGSPYFLVTRATVSDANVQSGSYATVGSNVSACVTQARIRLPGGSLAGDLSGFDTNRVGILSRYVDPNNWLFGGLSAYYDIAGTRGRFGYLTVYKRVGGTVTQLGILGASPGNPGIGSPYLALADYHYLLKLAVEDSGEWAMYWDTLGSAPVFSGNDPDLAAGGALASGKCGLYDAWASATAGTRAYDDFISWAPAADAVIFASQSLELATEGITREDASGAGFGPVTSVIGDLPRMPNRSAGDTVEVFIKASRGDLQTMTDPSIDNISARVYRRASHLLVP